MTERKKILVGMSGGVDSSVTAALLKNQGHDVIGAFIQVADSNDNQLRGLKEEGGGAGFGARCCTSLNQEDVKRICDQLDIPFYLINAQEEFQEKVVDYFVHEYLQSRIPNPCVPCNINIKLKKLHEKADSLECQWIATGHYAQITYDSTSGIHHLEKAVDSLNDQTYFLHHLTQKVLKRTLMPLGGLTKAMVGRLATEFDLLLTQERDAQKICFIDDPQYIHFIESRIAPSLMSAGMIRTVEGAIIGEHEGLYRFTIGQNAGFEIRVKEPEHYFVVGFDPKSHALIVGEEKFLYKKEIMASHLNWVRPINQLQSIRCKAKIRPRHEEAFCRVTCFENEIAHIEFDEDQRAIAPGQMIVFYDAQEVLGGATILSVGESPGIPGTLTSK